MTFLDKNNFSLFEFRPEALNLSPMEEEYGIKLPPLYKLFLEVYSDEFMHPAIYLPDEKNIHPSTMLPNYKNKKHVLGQSDYYSLNDDLKRRGKYAFEKFYEPKTFFETANDLKGEWETENGYMFIAKHGFDVGFAVGIKEHNLDKIFYIPDSEEAFLLEENIFKFISKFEVFLDPDLLKESDLPKLYRNYGEKFWRLKKDEDNIK